ncbi:hypothetical protein BU16DRAFT_566222 [Lophium mytilinum]|uniref:Uncharacterized protein n=1 Tax=Lophium mytilinum TaxID=390894 RepID=A0A6A6QF02_9PEZI|nr:hypothetical protein BU16DRAFT_566222 [Lophium mytilinum]
MPPKSIGKADSAETDLEVNDALAIGVTSISLKTDPASEAREVRRRAAQLFSSRIPAAQDAASVPHLKGTSPSALPAFGTATPTPAPRALAYPNLVPTKLDGVDHLTRRQEQLEAIYAALEKANIRFKSNSPKEYLIEIARAREDIYTQKRPFHAPPTAYTEEKYLDLMEYEIAKKIHGANKKSWNNLIAKHSKNQNAVPTYAPPTAAQVPLPMQLIPSAVQSKIPLSLRQKHLDALFEAYQNANNKHLRFGHPILLESADLINLSRQAEAARAIVPTETDYRIGLENDVKTIRDFKTRDWWRAVAKFLRPFQVAAQAPVRPELLPRDVKGIDMSTTRQNRLNALYNTLGHVNERHIRQGKRLLGDAAVVTIASILEKRSVRTHSRVRTEDEYLEEMQMAIESYWHSTKSTLFSLIREFEPTRKELRKRQDEEAEKEAGIVDDSDGENGSGVRRGTRPMMRGEEWQLAT